MQNNEKLDADKLVVKAFCRSGSGNEAFAQVNGPGDPVIKRNQSCHHYS